MVQTVTTGSMVREESIATLVDNHEYTNTNKFDAVDKSDSDGNFLKVSMAYGVDGCWDYIELNSRRKLMVKLNKVME